MKLRTYQKEALESIISSFMAQNRYTLVQLPTGAGKSAIAASLVKWANTQFGAKCLVLAHQKELVAQMADNLRKWAEMTEIGVYCASIDKTKTQKAVTVGSRQSIAREKTLDYNLVIIDEVHLWSQQYADICDRLPPRCRVLGITATPFKTGLGYLWECTPFSEPVYRKTLDSMIEDGFLCTYEYLVTAGKIGDGVKKSKGDFNIEALAEEMKMPRHMESVKKAIEDYAQDRTHIVVYAVNIEHAEALADMLGCPVVHSKNDYEIEDWKGGIIVNIGMMTTGLDIPQIDCIVMARPTLSPSLWIQICGRGLRLKGKNCLILDVVGNIVRHGDLSNPDLRISGEAKEMAEKEREACICLDCFKLNEPDAEVCAHCGVEMRRLVDWRAENERYKMEKLKLQPQPVTVRNIEIRRTTDKFSGRKGNSVLIQTWCRKNIYMFIAYKFDKGNKRIDELQSVTEGDTIWIRQIKKRWKLCAGLENLGKLR